MRSDKVEEYVNSYFTTEEVVEINYLKDRLNECAKADLYFEISGKTSKLLLRYITQIEKIMFGRE